MCLPYCFSTLFRFGLPSSLLDKKDIIATAKYGFQQGKHFNIQRIMIIIICLFDTVLINIRDILNYGRRDQCDLLYLLWNQTFPFFFFMLCGFEFLMKFNNWFLCGKWRKIKTTQKFFFLNFFHEFIFLVNFCFFSSQVLSTILRKAKDEKRYNSSLWCLMAYK